MTNPTDNTKPFSERMGFVPTKPMQVDYLDPAARNAIYNAILMAVPQHTEWQEFEELWENVGQNFFHLRIDDVRYGYTNSMRGFPAVNQKFKNLIVNGDWYRTFDLVEYIYNHINANTHKGWDIGTLHNLTGFLNAALQKEKVGYRLDSNGKIIPLTNAEEMQAVEQAQACPHANAAAHIKKATALFAARPTGDYANSIKESIQAVESLVTTLADENNFNKAVEKLDIPMHPQFKTAAQNLYNFTSDEKGIRHSTSGEPVQCDEPTARFMLITCSAIVNYITAHKKP